MKTHSGVNQEVAPITLYDRLGGETFVPIFVESFFDEFVGDTRMDVFFHQVNISCLKLHQIKFYRLMFGPEHLRPDYADLVDYMLLTHSRLFQIGLDEKHFDMIATGFVRGLQDRMVDQDLIDEAVAILAPLRELFEYGSKLATSSKKGKKSSSGTIMVANHKTLEEGNLDVVLADYTMGVGTPECLKKAISRTKPNVKAATLREWVCELAELFGIDNDIHVAEYFMSMPFMDQYPYIVHFMMIAFVDLPPSETAALVDKIKYPKGPSRSTPSLPQVHFVSMVEYFVEVCQEKGLKTREIDRAEKRLMACRKSFPTKVEDGVGGINAPHCLQKEMVHDGNDDIAEGRTPGDEDKPILVEPGLKDQQEHDQVLAVKNDTTRPEKKNKKKKLSSSFRKMFKEDKDRPKPKEKKKKPSSSFRKLSLFKPQ